MTKRKASRLISILLCVVMLMSALVTAFSVETFAASNVDITIASVQRNYKETVTFLTMCNDYRKSHGLSEWKMDKELTSAAWVRAAELAIYPSVNPPGTSPYSSLSGTKGQILGVDVFNLSTLINYDTADQAYFETLNSSDLNAVGIGIVVIRGKKYVALLATNKNVTAVDQSELTQDDKIVNQKVNVSSSILSGIITLNYGSGEKFYCGETWTIQFATKNSQGGKAWLTADCATLTSSDPDVFAAGSNCTITGKKEGKSTITLTLKNNTAITASAEYEAVAKYFEDCEIDPIPDQTYTGSAITPEVTIKDNYVNKKLVKDKDFTVSYSNNTNVGKATVTITGKGAYIGQTMTTNFNIVSSGNTFSVRLTLGSSTVYAGDTVKLTAAASGGTGTIQYKFEANGSSVQSGTNASCSYKPTSAGTVTIKVTASDSSGKTASENASLTVKAGLSATLSLSANSITLGNTATIKAAASGGSGNYKYSYYVIVPGNSDYTTLSSNSTSASYAYKPTKAGTHNIKITVSDDSGHSVSRTTSLSVTSVEALKNNSTISATTINFGSKVTLKGAASGGTSPYKYAFYYKKTTETNWSVIGTAFGSETSQTFSPSASTTYDIKITVKDSASKTSDKTFTLSVVKPQSLTNNSTVEPKSAAVGAEVTLKGAASGGTAPYTYAYYYKKSSSSTWTKIGTEFSSTTTQSFKPGSETTYDVKISVKDVTGTVVTSTFTITASASADLYNSSTISSTIVDTGSAVTLKGAASGGKSPYKYAFYYKKSTSSSWTKIGTEFGTAVSAVFTPGTEATYNAKVVVKDSAGKTATKTFNVTAKTPLSNNSSVSKTNIPAGNAVTLKGAASGGTSPYTYAYYYRKSSTTTWTTISGYSSKTSASFTPAAAGTYVARISVKDNSGKVVSKSFDITVINAIVNSSTISSTSVKVGNSVTMKGAASGGTSPYKYAFYYKKSTSSSWTKIGTEFGTAVSASFKPGSEGTYNAKVTVKDNNGFKKDKTFSVTVNAADPLKNSSTVSTNVVIVGNSVTLKGSASGGIAPYTYAFYYKKSSSSTWTTIGTAFGSATSATFTPGTVAQYDVKIVVKDKNGATAAKTSAVTVNARPALTNKSTVSATTVSVGNSVTIKGSASYGTSPYKYAYYYKKSSSSSWIKIGTEFGTATSATFTPTAVIDYNVKVVVKDSANATATKTFTIKVV